MHQFIFIKGLRFDDTNNQFDMLFRYGSLVKFIYTVFSFGLGYSGENACKSQYLGLRLCQEGRAKTMFLGQKIDN